MKVISKIPMANFLSPLLLQSTVGYQSKKVNITNSVNTCKFLTLKYYIDNFQPLS